MQLLIFLTLFLTHEHHDDCPHCVSEETKVQGGKMPCPRGHTSRVLHWSPTTYCSVPSRLLDHVSIRLSEYPGLPEHHVIPQPPKQPARRPEYLYDTCRPSTDPGTSELGSLGAGRVLLFTGVGKQGPERVPCEDFTARRHVAPCGLSPRLYPLLAV